MSRSGAFLIGLLVTGIAVEGMMAVDRYTGLTYPSCIWRPLEWRMQDSYCLQSGPAESWRQMTPGQRWRTVFVP